MAHIFIGHAEQKPMMQDPATLTVELYELTFEQRGSVVSLRATTKSHRDMTPEDVDWVRGYFEDMGKWEKMVGTFLHFFNDAGILTPNPDIMKRYDKDYDSNRYELKVARVKRDTIEGEIFFSPAENSRSGVGLPETSFKVREEPPLHEAPQREAGRVIQLPLEQILRQTEVEPEQHEEDATPTDNEARLVTKEVNPGNQLAVREVIEHARNVRKWRDFRRLLRWSIRETAKEGFV